MITNFFCDYFFSRHLLQMDLINGVYGGWRYLMDELSDPRTNEWPLMSSPFPTIAISLTYAYIVKVSTLGFRNHSLFVSFQFGLNTGSHKLTICNGINLFWIADFESVFRIFDTSYFDIEVENHIKLWFSRLSNLDRICTGFVFHNSMPS